MKPFNTLKTNELANLTDDEVQEYIDYKCAENGVSLAIAEPVRPIMPEKKYDLNLVEIESMTVEPDIGKKIQEVIENARFYNKYWGNDYYKLLDSSNKPDIKYITGQSKGQHELEKIEHAAEQNALKNYEKMMEDYNVAIEGRNEIIDEINSAKRDAFYKVDTFNRQWVEWERYLKLASNDRDTAKRFFCDRYNVTTFDEMMEWKDESFEQEHQQDELS